MTYYTVDLNCVPKADTAKGIVYASPWHLSLTVQARNPILACEKAERAAAAGYPGISDDVTDWFAYKVSPGTAGVFINCL